MYSPPSFGGRSFRGKKKTFGREQTVSQLSPRPNYDKEVDEVVEQRVRATVTAEGIWQMEQQLVSDLLEDLRKDSQTQFHSVASIERNGFL